MATTYALDNKQLLTGVTFKPGALYPEDINKIQDLNQALISNSVSNLFRYGIVSNSNPATNIGSLAISFPFSDRSVQMDPGTAIFRDGVTYVQNETHSVNISQVTGVTNYVLSLLKEKIGLTQRYNPLKDRIEDYESGYQFYLKVCSQDEYGALGIEELNNYIYLASLISSGSGFRISSTSNRPWMTTPDKEHRAYIGTGTVSSSNPHGMSLNDLNPMPNMTFWEQADLTGVISNVASGNNRGDFTTQNITPEELSNNVYRHVSCRVATTEDDVFTASLNASGLILTNTGSSAILTIDGVNVSVNDRVLIKNQVDYEKNGVYVVTNVGSSSTKWVLTRALDFNSNSNILKGDLFEVTQGTENYGTVWMANILGDFVMGADDILFESYIDNIVEGVSFKLMRGAAYVLSVVDSETNLNLNFKYNRATRTITCYPDYVIKNNLIVSAIVINIGTVTQKMGSGATIQIDGGIEGELLVSKTTSIPVLSTNELNIQNLSGAIGEYSVYCLNSGAVKISPVPITQVDLFQLESGLQETIYLPSNNVVNIALTNFKVPSTFTIKLQVQGSGGTEIIDITDPITAASTGFRSFNVPAGTDLTMQGTELKEYSEGTQWVSTSSRHSYISSLSVISSTGLPSTIGFLITQNDTPQEAVNLAIIKLTNKGNISSIIDTREQKIFTEKQYDAIFFEDFYNPLNFNPSISSTTLNPALYKNTWFSRPIKLDAGVYRVSLTMDALDILPDVGYTTDFGSNITNFQETTIEAGFNHKIYTFTLTESKYLSLYVSTLNSKETKLRSISIDVVQSPTSIQFGMPTGVYEGFEPTISQINRKVTLSVDSDSLRSLACLSYSTGTFYYQRQDDIQIPALDVRSGFNRLDLITLKYKNQSFVPTFVVFKGIAGDTEPMITDDSSYDSTYNYLVLAKVTIPSNSTIPMLVRNYSGNQGTGKNYRMSYFNSIAQEVEAARNNFPSLSYELTNTRNATILNSRAGLISFTASVGTAAIEAAEVVDNLNEVIRSGNTIIRNGGNDGLNILTPGIYEITALVKPDSAFSNAGYGDLKILMDYTDGSGNQETEELDHDQALFGEKVQAIVKVESSWTGVLIYFERAGTYAGLLRGSIKFLNQLPSEVSPVTGSLDGIPIIMDVLLNGNSLNSISVIDGAAVNISALFDGEGSLSGLDFNGILSSGIPITISASAGTEEYTLSVTKNGRTISTTFEIQAS